MFRLVFEIIKGSSPLARGLLKRQARKILLEGIIPARAGFTHFSKAFFMTIRDHPRSRGVYAPTTSDQWDEFGSSPLARGLHH